MGRPKSLLIGRDGRSMVESVCDVAGRTTPPPAEIVVLGETQPLPGVASRLPTLPDGVEDGGPLAGLVSLLTRAGDRWALLLACDMPRLEPPLLDRLLGETDAKTDAVAYRRGDGTERCHGCCALYHPRILPAVRERLASDQRGLQSLLDGIRTTRLVPSAAESDQLANVNTPEDYRRLIGE